jgi:hypothetical protein
MQKFLINGREYEWADLTLILGGRDVVGFRGITYTPKIEREALHAKGREPRGIQSGNKTYEGEIVMLQSEFEMLVAAAPNKDIFNLSLDGLLCYGNPSTGDALLYDRIEGLRFTEGSKQWTQGDRFSEITLPFIATGIQHQV